jgi:hypothetical protein
MAEVLVRDGTCELLCPSNQAGDLASALSLLGLRAIDTGSLLLHAFLERIDRSGQILRATVALEAPSS